MGTAIGWCAWFLVLLSIDPVEAGTLALVMFYVTLTVGLSGTLTTLATLLRVIRTPERDLEEVVIISIRQSLLLTCLVIMTLILLSQELLVWWSLLLLIGLVGAIEFFALIGRKSVKK